MDGFKMIVVGLDLDSKSENLTLGSQKALQEALKVAEGGRASIVFEHSVYDEEFSGDESERAREADERLLALDRRALREALNEATRAGIMALVSTSTDRPWLGLCRKAIATEADLVIVGKRNESPDDGRLIGSVAVKLLRKCPTAVWAVKPEHDLNHRLVLCATDLGEVGDQALAAASWVAGCRAAELHAVHAWQLPFALQMASSRMAEAEHEEALESIKRASIEHINSSLSEHDPAAKVEIHTAKGSPARIIQEAVTHLDPDLLVMGTISRGGIAGLLIGSTAERMLDRVDCSILAVKPAGFVSPVA